MFQADRLTMYIAGPKGCLQYYTETESCLVRNFGMPSSGTVGASSKLNICGLAHTCQADFNSVS